ncbi:hypothetical protein T492DRAFT_894996 [Pavlovales sp. CCMP2436]|nr:hypothetical protein T492DRAFT_894996 [Pavlovales sp. CCMP2436]
MRLQLGWRQILRVLGGCNLVLLIFASIALTPPPPQPQEFSKLSPAEGVLQDAVSRK